LKIQTHESRKYTEVGRSWRVRNGKTLAKQYKHAFIRWANSGHLIYSMAPIVIKNALFKVKPPCTVKIHFKKMKYKKKVKQILSRGGYQWEGSGHKERVNEYEYGGFILYSNMKIREWNLLILFKKGRREKKENCGGGKSKLT
jgi:hypothetical protein